MKAESKKKLIKQVFFICPDTRWYSSQCFWNRKSNGAISHPCPIHPNWVDLCEALYDSTWFAQRRSIASICTTGSQDPWNTGNHDTWTFLVLKTWQETSVDLYEALYDSTWFVRSCAFHKSTSGMTNRQQGKRFVSIRSNRQQFQPTLHSSGALYFLSLAQMDFRHLVTVCRLF